MLPKLCHLDNDLVIIIIIYKKALCRAAGFTLRNEKKCLPGFQLEKLKSS